MKNMHKFSLSIALVCAFFSVAAQQLIPVKSNMGTPDEIFEKRALMQNLAPSATESNVYFLPVFRQSGNQWNGSFYVNSSTGFSFVDNIRNQNFSGIELTGPGGYTIRVLGGSASCNNQACPTDKVNVSLSGIRNNQRTRTVSVNQEINMVGRWTVRLTNLPSTVLPKDYMIMHEDSIAVAIYDEDQTSVTGQGNTFRIELRNFRQLLPQPVLEIPDAQRLIPASQISNIQANVRILPIGGALPRSPVYAAAPGNGVVINPNGNITTQIPSLPAGDYTLDIDFRATLTNGEVVQRTAYYGFPVLSRPVLLQETSHATIVDDKRLKINVESKPLKEQDHLVLYAEIWSGDTPISYINSMTYFDKGSNGKIPVVLDSRWFALANKANIQSFELKNVKLLDPDTFIVVEQKDQIKVSIDQMPKAAATRANEIKLDQEMLFGVDDVLVPFADAPSAGIAANRGTADNGIFLVHGWCDTNAAWNQFDFNDGPTFEYTNNDRSLSRNNFARAIRDQADPTFRDWFSVVAHSQGGQAAVHLQAYFFSGLDLSPAPRPIQTVGTPYQGSTLMDLYFAYGLGWILNEIFNFSDCEPQFTLTTPSSYFWSIFLPRASQEDTFYYRTIHDTPNNFFQALQFWRWKCNFASYILLGRDDGVVRPFKSWLVFGNNMGITESQCHTGGMRYMDQRDDRGRNDIMDRMGRVQATWTAWLNRDRPSGSGDWEQRSLHTGVCAAPLNFEARRTGTNIPAASTGEVFFRFSAADGLVCRNADQPDNTCFDYEVRFLCP